MTRDPRPLNGDNIGQLKNTMLGKLKLELYLTLLTKPSLKGTKDKQEYDTIKFLKENRRISLKLAYAIIFQKWHQKYKQQKQNPESGTTSMLKASAQQKKPSTEWNGKPQNERTYVPTTYLIRE